MPLARRDPPRSSSPQAELRATLAEHLDELRTRAIRVVIAIMISMVLSWIFVWPTYNFIDQLVRSSVPKGLVYKEVTTHITEPFMLQIKLSFYLGLILALPYAVSQIWAFVAPGLKPTERKPVLMLTPVCLVLFALGLTIGWFTLPAMFQWFFAYAQAGGFEVYQEPGKMIMLVVKTLLGFGLAFQMPVVVFFLTRLGLVTPETLRTYWKHVVVSNIIVAAIITPGSDPVSLAAMAIPIIALFYLGVFAATWSMKSAGRDAALNQLDAPPC